MAEQVSVLVVEDEAMIQQVIEETLIDAGFAVTVADDGEEAIERLGVEQAAFRAVVTDVNLLPERATGWDVARHARELHPDLPIVYITGGSANEWTSMGVPGSVLVPKPFVAMQIVTALSTLLNNASGAASVAAV